MRFGWEQPASLGCVFIVLICKLCFWALVIWAIVKFVSS